LKTVVVYWTDKTTSTQRVSAVEFKDNLVFLYDKDGGLSSVISPTNFYSISIN